MDVNLGGTLLFTPEQGMTRQPSEVLVGEVDKVCVGPQVFLQCDPSESSGQTPRPKPRQGWIGNTSSCRIYIY